MTRLPALTGKSLIAALAKAGFQVIRMRGFDMGITFQYNVLEVDSDTIRSRYNHAMHSDRCFTADDLAVRAADIVAHVASHWRELQRP